MSAGLFFAKPYSPPSVWAWSTMPTSSSSVIPSSPLARNTFAISLYIAQPHPPEDAGGRGQPPGGQDPGAGGRVLGVISPNTRIITVSATVATVGPYWWNHLVHSTVDTVVAVILTMLLPIRMVESSSA